MTATARAVLAVGGLDPSGGAGVLMDAVAARAAGAHAAAVVAVDTVQDARRLFSSEPREADEVVRAMDAVKMGVRLFAAKTGALGNRKIVEAVARFVDQGDGLPLVLDPVFASTSGGVLLDDQGVEALRDLLVQRALLVTPNLEEARRLTGMDVADIQGMRRAAGALVEMGARAALVKGGHLLGEGMADVLALRDGKARVFEDERIPGGNVRGTGCALASMIAGFLAQGRELQAAVQEARALLGRAMEAAEEIGPGHRVLSFAWTHRRSD